METLNMSKKELNQISIFDKLAVKEIKQKQAAKQLGIGIRQVKRKLKEYRRLGAASLAHKGRGAAGNHTLDPAVKSEALSLVSNLYPDFGPTFASEKLEEIHNLKIHPETLRLLMADDGIWKIKHQKVETHFWRERKETFGEMAQLDGSPHDWFEDRADRCALLAFIDDATSQILHLEFADSESTASIMNATKKYLLKHGRPVSYYSDRGSVYKVNLNNKEKDKLTQYGRALTELDIELIYARSPQAKGRVERLFGILQDRLVKEMRLRDISSMKEANRYLEEEYIAIHNAKFSVKPAEEGDLHQSIDGCIFDDIFCLKEERKVNNDMTVQYKTKWFQIEKVQPTIVRPKDIVEIWEKLAGTITIVLRKTKLDHTELLNKPIKQVLLKERIEKTPWIPSKDHPWRNITKSKSDISILEKGDISILV